MGMGDIGTSMRFRDVVTRISEGVVNRMRPEERIGRAFSYDSSTQTVKVLFPGEDVNSLVTAFCPLNLVPSVLMVSRYNAVGLSAPGDLLRISGKPTQYYVSGFVDGMPSPHPQEIVKLNTMNRVQNVAYYQESSNNLSGYILIQTNMTFVDTMTKLEIKGYNYQSGSSDINLSVTFYSYGVDQNFYNFGAVNNGTTPIGDVLFLRRNSDGKVAIAIQMPTFLPAPYNQWQYPKITVDALFGAVELPRSAVLGWQISRVTSLAGYTTKRTVQAYTPFVRYVGTATSIPHASLVTITSWTQSVGHSAIPYSGGAWIIQEPGIYQMNFSAMFRNENSSNGVRAAYILINGSGEANSYGPPMPAQQDYVTTSVSHALYLLPGAAVSCAVLQNSGGAVTLHQSPFTQFTMTKVGR